MPVELNMHRALEKKYSEAVDDIEWVMKNPLKACEKCANEKTCAKNGVHCVPVWKGRRQ